MRSSPITEVTIALHLKEEEVEDQVHHHHHQLQAVVVAMSSGTPKVTTWFTRTTTTREIAHHSTASGVSEQAQALSASSKTGKMWRASPRAFVPRILPARPSRQAHAEADEEQRTLG